MRKTQKEWKAVLPGSVQLGTKQQNELLKEIGSGKLENVFWAQHPRCKGPLKKMLEKSLTENSNPRCHEYVELMITDEFIKYQIDGNFTYPGKKTQKMLFSWGNFSAHDSR